MVIARQLRVERWLWSSVWTVLRRLQQRSKTLSENVSDVVQRVFEERRDRGFRQRRVVELCCLQEEEEILNVFWFAFLFYT